MAINPRPPICMRTRITICPNRLHVETVGRVTSPVTQVDVVAVKRASIKGVASPFAELMGKDSKTAPTKIAIKKLNNIICVVDNIFCLFFTANFNPFLFIF
jgi:hypothetical protein